MDDGITALQKRREFAVRTVVGIQKGNIGPGAGGLKPTATTSWLRRRSSAQVKYPRKPVPPIITMRI
jgi:hypothetical protein